jgi:ABC-type antimicrobial peptide transport system permease subunit
MAFLVTQRSHEIGVRMALGARRSDVVRMVVREGMGVTLGGTIAGLVAALTLTRFMASLLYEVEPTDASTFAVITAVLAATALLACCVPALKAVRIDPMTTLRSE